MKKKIFEPSPKSKRVFNSVDNSKHLLLEGAVRSSKSYTANLYAIDYISKLPPCNILISGYTVSSVARNVIGEWRAMLDPYNLGLFKENKNAGDNYLTINWRGLRGKKFYIRGGGKENDQNYIQGATFGFWYCDEATRHCQSFIHQALSRLSSEYSRSVWTMNPDSPFHYVKTEYIDDEKKYKKDKNGWSTYQKFHYLLKDNMSLTEQYKMECENMYTGVFKKRYIDGLWVLAEGLIYDFFDKDIHTFSHNEYNSYQYNVGVDYGQKNPCTFELCGFPLIQTPNQPRIWVQDEYYYSSGLEKKIKTDLEYSHDMLKFLSKYTSDYDRIVEQEFGISELLDLKKLRIDDKHIGYIYIDPSALSFQTQLRNLGISNVEPADNTVIDGIRTVQRMLKSGELAIHQNAQYLIKEMQTYSFDEKKQLLGIDAPKKEHDHCCDALRYIIYSMFGENIINYERLNQF